MLQNKQYNFIQNILRKQILYQHAQNSPRPYTHGEGAFFKWGRGYW